MLVEPLGFMRGSVAALSSSANNYALQVQAYTSQTAWFCLLSKAAL